MVHALHEIWRALAADGHLLDLRPLSSNPIIEVVTRGGAVAVGGVDDSEEVPDDAAADRAIRRVIDDGWFVTRKHRPFDVEHYWDSVEEMASFIETRRHKLHVHPSYRDLEKIHHDLNAGAGGMARLRCRWRAGLGVYRKAGLRPVGHPPSS